MPSRYVESAQTSKTLKEMTRLVGECERPAAVVSNHGTHGRTSPTYFAFAGLRDFVGDRLGDPRRGGARG